ncbi:hypothetical protein CBOM_00149 [Ceraceosorus bombacis]|uniref:Uncharacterized protein n=1 Tax=Ceraceosorus bombacis TaxID=401625 RepID=A0A0P1B9A8_9BASI|nr:hypothetical protein CBOM_00149 [Ceraceosorus bombacis]
MFASPGCYVQTSPLSIDEELKMVRTVVDLVKTNKRIRDDAEKEMPDKGSAFWKLVAADEDSKQGAEVLRKFGLTHVRALANVASSMMGIPSRVLSNFEAATHKAQSFERHLNTMSEIDIITHYAKLSALNNATLDTCARIGQRLDLVHNQFWSRISAATEKNQLWASLSAAAEKLVAVREVDAAEARFRALAAAKDTSRATIKEAWLALEKAESTRDLLDDESERHAKRRSTDESAESQE